MNASQSDGAAPVPSDGDDDGGAKKAPRAFRDLTGDEWDQERDQEAKDAADAESFKTLSRAEAESLRAKHAPMSPWRIVQGQALLGAVIVLAWWLFTGSGDKTGSALCGAAAVVLPNALMAWGMTRLLRGVPGAAVLGFMVWELIKIMLAVAMLAAAAIWMPDLHWPALLVGLIGCLKVNWVVLLWQGRSNKHYGH